MKATKTTESGKNLFYLDKNDKLIKIGDTLKVNANSGSNYGAVKYVEGVLTNIDDYGKFEINGDKFNVSAKCLHGKGEANEIYFKCYNHETNGHTYSAEII